jgi:hypothetical protein
MGMVAKDTTDARTGAEPDIGLRGIVVAGWQKCSSGVQVALSNAAKRNMTKMMY